MERARILILASLFSWALPSVATASSYHCGSDCEQTLRESRATLSRLEEHSEKIVGIELVLATPSTTHVYNRWGHALLRFVTDDGNPVGDSVLEFVAMVSEDNVSLRKGLFGGYAAVPQFDTLGGFWKEYVTQEDRDLVRSIIPTSPQMRSRILHTLDAWIADPKKHLHDYTFANNNCAGVMTRFLQEAGFPYSGIRARIPDHVPRYLKRLLLNPYPALVIGNPGELFSRTSEILGIDQESFRAGKSWPDDSARKIAESLPDLDIKKLLEFVPAMPARVRSELREKYGFTYGLELAELLGIQSVPAPLYQTCLDMACVEKLESLEKQLWSEEKLAEARAGRDASARKTLRHPKKSVLEATDVVTHFQLLLQEDREESPSENQ